MMATPIHGAPVGIPLHQQQRPHNASTVKGLAVTQLVIGVLSGILGIAVVACTYTDASTTNIAAGIWAGCWIGITGVVGVCTTRNYSNLNLKGVYMAFSIISTCASGLAGLFFIVAVAFYSQTRSCHRLEIEYGYDCNYIEVGLGLHIPLLVLMIVEFFVSIVAAAYSCQNCCGPNQPGVVIQQQCPGQVISQYGVQMAPPHYSGPIVPQYAGHVVPQYGGHVVPQYGGHVVPQYNGQMAQQHGGQPMVMQTQYPMHVSVVHNEKPPEYNAAPN